jgi:hypothetical protein
MEQSERPGDVSFENAAMATTRATFDQLGTYVLQLVASDSQLSATDQVSINVYPSSLLWQRAVPIK